MKECVDGTPKQHYMLPDNNGKSSLRKTTDNLGCAVFQTTQDDDKPGLFCGRQSFSRNHGP